jgi:hypothetical protein
MESSLFDHQVRFAASFWSLLSSSSFFCSRKVAVKDEAPLSVSSSASSAGDIINGIRSKDGSQSKGRADGACELTNGVGVIFEEGSDPLLVSSRGTWSFHGKFPHVLLIDGSSQASSLDH